MNATVKKAAAAGIRELKDEFIKLRELRNERMHELTVKSAEIDALGSTINGYTSRLAGINADIQELERLANASPAPTLNDIKDIYETQGKLSAVKAFKDVTQASLMDAKRSIEGMAMNLNWKAPVSSAPSFFKS